MTEIFSKINKHLGIRTLPLSYTEYTEACFELFSDARTLVFVDTNILGLPFRFHNRAREGFYSLLAIASSQKRLIVPGWASNEFFHRAFKSNGTTHGFTSSVSKQLGNAPSADSVRKILSRVLSDEELDAYSKQNLVDREGVIEDLARRIDKWNKDIDRLGKDLDAEFIHGELLNALEDSFRSLDFATHCGLLEKWSDRRRANRIPPGLTDGNKANAGARGASVGNVDGDLALWLEILLVAQKEIRASGPLSDYTRYDHVVILCEERKDDFLYTPSSRQREAPERPHQSKPMKNELPPIKLPDPRLVSEFESMVGHRSLAFITMEELARGSLGARPDRRIKQFIEALTQQKDTKESRADDVEAEELVVAHHEELLNEADVPQAAPAMSPLAIPESAMRDEKAYIAGLPPGKEKEIITQINTHNWYVQNPAILELRASTIPIDLGAAFVLGRAVYQAADGSAWRASEFLRDFDAWVSEPAEGEQAFVAGAAYEMFFDGRGMLRGLPKSGAMDLIMDLLASARWTPAWGYVEAELRRAGRIVLSRPGQPLPPIRLQILHEENGGRHLVSDVILHIDGHESVSLKAASIGDPLMLYTVRIDALVEDVAEALLVKDEAITVQKTPAIDDDTPLGFPPGFIVSLTPVVELMSIST